MRKVAKFRLAKKPYRNLFKSWDKMLVPDFDELNIRKNYTLIENPNFCTQFPKLFEIVTNKLLSLAP